MWSSNLLQHPLCARHIGDACVGFYRHAECPGGRFEDTFGDVVAVAAVVQVDVQIAQAVEGDGLPEFGDELAVELADGRCGQVDVEDEVGPPAQVDGRRDECSSIGSVKCP